MNPIYSPLSLSLSLSLLWAFIRIYTYNNRINGKYNICRCIRVIGKISLCPLFLLWSPLEYYLYLQIFKHNGRKYSQNGKRDIFLQKTKNFLSLEMLFQNCILIVAFLNCKFGYVHCTNVPIYFLFVT